MIITLHVYNQQKNNYLLRLKKKHKLSSYGIETRSKRISHGQFGIKALEGGYITSKQIEAARKAIIKQIKKIGVLYIRIVYPVSKNRYLNYQIKKNQ